MSISDLSYICAIPSVRHDKNIISDRIHEGVPIFVSLFLLLLLFVSVTVLLIFTVTISDVSTLGCIGILFVAIAALIIEIIVVVVVVVVIVGLMVDEMVIDADWMVDVTMEIRLCGTRITFFTLWERNLWRNQRQ